MDAKEVKEVFRKEVKEVKEVFRYPPYLTIPNVIIDTFSENTRKLSLSLYLHHQSHTLPTCILLDLATVNRLEKVKIQDQNFLPSCTLTD